LRLEFERGNSGKFRWDSGTGGPVATQFEYLVSQMSVLDMSKTTVASAADRIMGRNPEVPGSNPGPLDLHTCPRYSNILKRCNRQLEAGSAVAQFY